MSNPFVFSEPVAPTDLLDRDEEAALLVERAVGGHNSRLVAPRRYGKPRCCVAPSPTPTRKG
jgi:hypothetical protein